MGENKSQGLGIKELTSLAAGQVIGAGVVTLVGQAIGVTGRSVWLAYATAILLGFCIIFPYIMLSSMIRVKGGNYTFVSTILATAGAACTVWRSRLICLHAACSVCPWERI